MAPWLTQSTHTAYLAYVVAAAWPGNCCLTIYYGVPAAKEPTGLLRTDGKRLDRLALNYSFADWKDNHQGRYRHQCHCILFI